MARDRATSVGMAKEALNLHLPRSVADYRHGSKGVKAWEMVRFWVEATCLQGARLRIALQVS